MSPCPIGIDALNKTEQTYCGRGNLYGSESAEGGQTALGGRSRVRLGSVPVSENVSRGLVEAVRSPPARLMTVVADGRRRRVSLTDAVLVDGAQGTSALTLGLVVVRLVPQRLQPRLTFRAEPATTSVSISAAGHSISMPV